MPGPSRTQKRYLFRVEAVVRRFRVPLEDIAYVRMILEAYEGLAVMVSERGSTRVDWHVAPGREEEADELARALGLVELP
jgi:hypothetical protein